MTTRIWASGCLFLMAWMAAAAVSAVEVRFFRQQSAADFVDGDFEGLALDAEGALRPAAHFERLAAIEEPFVFGAARAGEGWLLGTGNAGRVISVTAEGDVSTLWTAPEPEVFALWVDDDGTTFVGSSPGGKVYRLTDTGDAEELFDPTETYIWALARAPWGDLLVATGDGAKLYALAADGTSRVVYESEEAHLRSLHALADSVLIGTAGEGLILSLDETGRVRTLYDAVQDEVTAFADDGAGTWYAAAVAAEASLTSSATAGAKEANGDEPGAGAEVSIEISEAPASRGGERSALVSGGRGDVRLVTGLAQETIYALAWLDGRLWLGTGVEGNVYSLLGGRLALETSLGDRQVVGLFDGTRPVLVSTNAAAVHRASSSSRAAGTYISKALDAGAMAHFGTLRWRGHSVAAEALQFAARSGLSAAPDATWSDWLDLDAGAEASLAGVPAGRFVQWRISVSPHAGDGARLSAVSLSYRQNNAAPTIEAFGAMDPGQVLVPSSFDPGDQIYEPAHPDRSGMFTTLEPSAGSNGGRLKTLWRQGFLTLRWEAKDANEDELRYDLSFAREGSKADFLPLAEDIDEPYYSFDATVLPDGLYRFRLVATDRRANTETTALAVDDVSEPIVVDHAPPALASVTREGSTLTLTVIDSLSPLRSAEVSVDGSEWRAVPATDGLLDSQRETLRLAVPQESRLVLLRTMDAAFNVVTFELEEKHP